MRRNLFPELHTGDVIEAGPFGVEPPQPSESAWRLLDPSGEQWVLRPCGELNLVGSSYSVRWESRAAQAAGPFIIQDRRTTCKRSRT